MAIDSELLGSKNTGVLTVKTQQWREQQLHTLNDDIIEEIPVALVYNGISHAVMMATPCDLEDFAIGFSLTEEIIDHINQIYSIEINSHVNGYTVDLEINSERMHFLKAKRRSLVGNSGCGLCGVESLEKIYRQGKQRNSHPLPSSKAIQYAVESLPLLQKIQQQTGACHATAWCDTSGKILLLREDVGRHNAFDKLIGAMKISNIKSEDGFVLISSRASYEMLYKASFLQCANLVAASAPTSMAIEQAKNLNINLIGFARDKKYNIYHRYPLIADGIE